MASLIETVFGAPAKPDRHPGTTETLLPHNPEVAERVEKLVDESERADATRSADYERQQSKQDEVQTAEAEKARWSDEYAGRPIVNDVDEDGRRIEYDAPGGPHTPKSFVLKLNAKIAAAKRTAELAARSTSESSAVAGAKSRITTSVKDYLADYAKIDGHGRMTLNRPTPLFKKGESPADFIDRKLAERVDLGRSLTECEQALPPADVLKGAISLQASQMSTGPRFVIKGGATKRAGPPQVDIVLPSEALLTVESARAGIVPSITDSAALFMWLNQDQIVAELHRQVDSIYVGRLALSDEDREGQTAELKASILAVEHEIAEAVWQSGGDFPPDLDPRAIIGVAGPEPRRERW